MADKVKMQLDGLDGNAFALMGAFSRNASRQGWTRDEIDTVMKECRSGDYDHPISNKHTIKSNKYPYYFL